MFGGEWTTGLGHSNGPLITNGVSGGGRDGGGGAAVREQLMGHALDRPSLGVGPAVLHHTALPTLSLRATESAAMARDCGRPLADCL